MAVLAICAESAWAGMFGVQAQFQYDLTQTKKSGLGIATNGQFSTNYNLMLRRPLLSSSSLISDLSFNSTESGGYMGSQTTKNWTLNMLSQKTTYTLIGRVNRSSYSGSQMTDYAASLFLREPAYPVLNIQCIRNITGSATSASDSLTSTWILGSYYDMQPLRFAYDRTQRSVNYPTYNTRTNSQRSAVTLNQTLLPGLELSGELSRNSVAQGLIGGTTSTNTDTRSLRLTATPTRSIAADIDFSSQATDLGAGRSNGNYSDHSVSWNVRSEIMPGLSLDYADQVQSQARNQMSGIINSTSRNRGGSLSARLSEDSILNVSKMINTMSDGSNTDSLQTAFHTSLTATTDFGIDYGKSQSSSSDTCFSGISIRDRSSTTMSLGASYRRNANRSTMSGDQFGDSIDLDMLWQPTYDMGLNLRLSYQRNRGATSSKALSPAANLRWQLDASTGMTVGYTLQRSDMSNLIAQQFSNTRSRGVTVRLTHAFPDRSSLDVSYDFQGGNMGDTNWRRQLRMYYSVLL